MSDYEILPRNRYFEVIGWLNRDNRGDNKVAMISEVDMSGCVRLRKSIGEKLGVKPSYTSFVARAVSLALKEHPYANRLPLEWPFFERIVQLLDIDITVAVERDQPGVEQGVFAATIRHADRLDLATLTRELQAIADGTGDSAQRWNVLRKLIDTLPVWLARRVLRLPLNFPSLWVQHRGGAAMISSPAKYGVDQLVGAWPWPLGFSFGLVKERPLAVDGAVVVRPTMAFIMSFDRRLMGGAPAARFFKAICDKLETAEQALG